MHRAAHGVSPGKSDIVQSLGDDALAGKGRVAVNQQRQKFLRAAFAGAVLLGACTADGHRIDGLQVAGVRHQVNMNFRSAAGHVLSGCAHVILHVAAAQHAARVHIFESGKDLFRRAPGHLHDDVQAAAVAHAHDQLGRAALSGGVQDFIHQRNQGGHAFQRKALAAQVPLLQNLLEQVGADQLIEHTFLIHRGLRPSMRSCIQRRRSGSAMCMNSAPTVPQ